MIEKQCRIEWVSKLTGFAGHGKWHPLEYLPSFKKLAKEMDKKYPELSHVANVQLVKSDLEVC